MRRARIVLIAELIVIGAACWWLSPLNTRTAFTAAAEYIQTTGFGPYDRIIFSHLHQRPFEVCEGVDALHAQALERVRQALPGIEASSRFEFVRLLRLVRTFNRETQTFYFSRCQTEWKYFYSYVDYQSWLLKVAPVIWLADSLHRSEIYVIVFLIFGSWFGIFCFFYTTKYLARSSWVGFASLGALWYSLHRVGASLQYADFRLNLLNTFSLVGLAVFLCDFKLRSRRWPRALMIEVPVALAFAACSLLLMFLRLPSTKLDATAVLACLFAVAVFRWDAGLLRRAVLVLICVTALQWPYQRYSASLMQPVSAVNTAAADEFKLVNAVQFLTERPSHFGHFLQDYQFTWIGFADYYLCQLSPIYSFHHGYPAWGRRFLTETLRHHVLELPDAWWRRFVAQMIFHGELSYDFYGAQRTIGVLTMWFGVLLFAVLTFGGRRTLSTWPLIGVIFWEVFGLHTFLALIHVHNIYLVKGVPMLWSALPCLTVVAAREVAVRSRQSWGDQYRHWSAAIHSSPRLAAAAALAVTLATAWFVRGTIQEVHATHVWRAVQVGQYYRDAYLEPDEIVRELDEIRRLGGDPPGAVSMYGAWALRAYTDRIGGYESVLGLRIDRDHVKKLTLDLFRRGLSEDPDNPHFYAYAYDIGDPDWALVFRKGLERFPQHPYAVMMSWYLNVLAGPVPGLDQARNRLFYEDAVHRQLGEYVSFRPGFRSRPALTVDTMVVSLDTTDGWLTTVLPGDTAFVEPFATYNSDRVSIGLFLKVLSGSVTGELVDMAGKRMADLPPMLAGDPISYRTWHFQDLPYAVPAAKGAMARLKLRAGPQGARFILRDLYPLVENPRWFR